ncbi:MAG: COX15/CtaA family protein [Burkholderiaceae bacterium]
MRTARLLVGTVLVLLVLIVASSAYLRLGSNGLGCSPWPQCYASHVSGTGAAADATSTATGIARSLHRLSASSVGILIVAMLFVSWRSLSTSAMRGAAVLLVLLTLALAMLGVATPSKLPAVTIGNLLGGMAMLGCAGWLFAALGSNPGDTSSRGSDGSSRDRALAVLALVLVMAQTALGGLLSARLAAAACTSLPLCGADGGMDLAGAMALLDPFLPAQAPALTPALDDARRALHVVHRLFGLLALVACVLAALRPASGPRDGWQPGLIAGLAGGAAVTGALMAGLHYPLPLAVVHNVMTALLMAVLGARIGAAAQRS